MKNNVFIINFFSKNKVIKKNFTSGFAKKLIKKKVKINLTKPAKLKKIHTVRVIKTKKLFNNFVFLYLRKLFNSFIKDGKKLVSINYFLKVTFFVCMKFFKKKKHFKKTNFFLLYLNQILNNVIPVVIYTNLMFRGKNILLPWISKNVKKNKLKIVRISVSWMKKAIHKRKEKTLFLKILSELEDSRKNKSETVLSKKNYYKEFYKNKYYIRFLKKRLWI